MGALVGGGESGSTGGAGAGADSSSCAPGMPGTAEISTGAGCSGGTSGGTCCAGRSVSPGQPEGSSLRVRVRAPGVGAAGVGYARARRGGRGQPRLPRRRRRSPPTRPCPGSPRGRGLQGQGSCRCSTGGAASCRAGAGKPPGKRQARTEGRALWTWRQGAAGERRAQQVESARSVARGRTSSWSFSSLASRQPAARGRGAGPSDRTGTRDDVFCGTARKSFQFVSRSARLGDGCLLGAPRLRRSRRHPRYVPRSRN
jgi:hypothetical protein